MNVMFKVIRAIIRVSEEYLCWICRLAALGIVYS